jgi:hypothetical protein
MRTIQLADQAVSIAPNEETIEVYTVVKVLADGAQATPGAHPIPARQIALSTVA